MNRFLMNALVNEQDQYIVFFDFDGKVILANKSFEDLVGLSNSQLTGKSLRELSINREIVDAFLMNNEKISEGKSANLTYNPSITLKGKRQWLQVQKRSLILKNPDITYILVVATDISEKKLVEERLSITQNEYKQLVDSAQDIIYKTDLNGNFRFVNSVVNQILGYTDSELVSMNIRDIVDEEDAEKLDEYLSQILKRVEANNYIEFRTRTKEGELKWLGQSFSYIRENGVVVGLQGVARNITVNKEAEAQLKRAKDLAEKTSVMKTGFISSMSHEFRTPLNAILGYSQILERSSTLTETEKEHILSISEGGEQLLSMINDILELSKLDSDEQRIESEPLTLEPFMSDFAQRYSARANEKGIAFNYNVPESYPEIIEIDFDKVSLILKNLLTNAIKFTNQGAVDFSFNTTTEMEGVHFLNITINDTGKGIPVEHQKNIFQPFWQEDSIKNKGTGLGLSLCKRLAEFMGGYISLESVYGQGTKVSVSIPFEIQSLSDSQPEQEVLIDSEIPIEKIKVLIVDDLEPNRTITRIILKEHGFEYKEAEDGQEAISILEDFEPHVILMDINMPVMDGIEATQHIRTLDGPLKDVPIIAVTAGGLKANKAELLNMGFSEYILKPFKEEELVSSIQRLVQKYVVNTHREHTQKVSAEEVSGFIKGMNGEKKGLIQKYLQSQDFDVIAQLPATLELNGDSDHPCIQRLVKAGREYDHLFVARVLAQLKKAPRITA